MTLRCSFDVVSYYFVTWICLKTGSTPHLWPATSRENGWLNPQLNLSQTKPHPPDVTPDGDAKIAEDSESISRLTCNILQPEDGGGADSLAHALTISQQALAVKAMGKPQDLMVHQGL